MKYVWLLLCFLLHAQVFAEVVSVAKVDSESLQPSLPSAPGYLARINNSSPDGLRSALERAEMLFMEGRLRSELPPASFVLHGPEVAVFFRENYSSNKNLIDLAARLSAFGVVDIQICETRTGVLGRDRSALLPFVGTVPFGPAEEQRLIDKEKYVYF